jgi:MFS family permease
MISDFVKVEEPEDEQNWEEIERSRLEKLARKAPLAKVILSREFFSLYTIAVAQVFFGYFVIISFKTYGGDFIFDDSFLTLIGSLGALFNGLSRIFWSSLLDHFPFRKINFALLSIQLGCILTIQLAVKAKYAYLVVVALSMMCEGAMASIVPTVTLQKFGLTRGHDVFGLMYSSYGLSSMLGSILVSTVGKTIGYQGMLVISGALAALAMLLTYRQDDKHVFNYARLYTKELKTFGETFTNKHGVQVRDMGA